MVMEGDLRRTEAALSRAVNKRVFAREFQREKALVPQNNDARGCGK